MSDLVLDASLSLQWFLEDDETGREYSLNVLRSLFQKRALVPSLWFYEVGNGLLMAYRRKRVSFDQVTAFLARLKVLPIDSAPLIPSDTFELPMLAHGLTNYDAAYLALALRFNVPLATADTALRKAASSMGVAIVAA